MTESRFQTTSPSLTEDEAKVLFVYHLQMAAVMFELLPDGYKLPKDRFDGYTEEAASAFLHYLEAAYTPPEEDADDGC